MMWRINRVILIGLGCVILAAAMYFLAGRATVDPSTVYGVTWSKPYAESLGVSSREGLIAMLDELGVRRFRLPAYWTEVEPQRGMFQWAWLDEQLNVIARRGGKAIVVIGAKQPRWPERWIPKWVSDLPTDEARHAAQLDYIRAAFGHLARHPALLAWQVENEPLFPFGEGMRQPGAFLKQEMRLVKELEAQTFAAAERHPIYTTASGEWSLWSYFHEVTDGIGISIYRLVLTPAGQVLHYDFLPPFFYIRKAWLFGRWAKYIFVSEFQMEPWARTPLPSVPLDEQLRLFDEARMREYFAYAERVHFPQVYFWGAEWWYWLKEKQGHPEFWAEAKQFFAQHRR